MNGLIGLFGVLTILLLIGGIIGVLDRKNFDWRWLLIAAALVALDDALLTRLYGLMPNLLPGERNWQGKLLALAATLAIVSLPDLGRRRAGIVAAQQPGSLKQAAPVVAGYCAFFLILALIFPNERPTVEEAAFQMTLPGLSEELFYRGLLLLVLDQAFTGRLRLLGVEWGWSAVLTSLLFGLTHAFGFSHGRFSFDAVTMALTALPSFIAVWLRLRTGSVLLPILIHNFGNAVTTLV